MPLQMLPQTSRRGEALALPKAIRVAAIVQTRVLDAVFLVFVDALLVLGGVVLEAAAFDAARELLRGGGGAEEL